MGLKPASWGQSCNGVEHVRLPGGVIAGLFLLDRLAVLGARAGDVVGTTGVYCSAEWKGIPLSGNVATLDGITNTC
jgi:hypothetical protein